MRNRSEIIDLFVLAYHNRNNDYCVYKDKYAGMLLSENEYRTIMYFLARIYKNKFKLKSVPFKNIVNNFLSAYVLGKYAFRKRVLDVAVKLGCTQYLVFNAGYDVSTIGTNFKCFEFNNEFFTEDKIFKLVSSGIDCFNVKYGLSNYDNYSLMFKNTNYDKDSLSFVSLFGISNLFDKDKFSDFLSYLGDNMCSGSTIVFDYDKKYDYFEMEQLLSRCGFRIYEYLNSDDINSEFFYDYNTLNPNNKILMDKDICFCLAVRK